MVTIVKFFALIMQMLCTSPHSKQCWVVLTQIWVKYGQTQMSG